MVSSRIKTILAPYVVLHQITVSVHAATPAFLSWMIHFLFDIQLKGKHCHPFAVMLFIEPQHLHLRHLVIHTTSSCPCACFVAPPPSGAFSDSSSIKCIQMIIISLQAPHANRRQLRRLLPTSTPPTERTRFLFHAPITPMC